MKLLILILGLATAQGALGFALPEETGKESTSDPAQIIVPTEAVTEESQAEDGAAGAAGSDAASSDGVGADAAVSGTTPNEAAGGDASGDDAAGGGPTHGDAAIGTGAPDAGTDVPEEPEEPDAANMVDEEDCAGFSNEILCEVSQAMILTTKMLERGARLTRPILEIFQSLTP